MLHGSILTQADHYFPFVKYCASYFKCLIPPHPPAPELTQAPRVNNLRSPCQRSVLIFTLVLWVQDFQSPRVSTDTKPTCLSTLTGDPYCTQFSSTYWCFSVKDSTYRERWRNQDGYYTGFSVQGKGWVHLFPPINLNGCVNAW